MVRPSLSSICQLQEKAANINLVVRTPEQKSREEETDHALPTGLPPGKGISTRSIR